MTLLVKFPLDKVFKEITKNFELIRILPDIHKNTIDLQIVQEQEATKREKIEKDYQLKVKELEVIDKIATESIKNKHKENMKTLFILEQLLNSGNTENTDMLLSLLGSVINRKYIDDEAVTSIKKVSDSNDDDYIDVYPEE